MTEILIFISLLGSYLYFSLKPSIEYNSQWLPLGIEKIEELNVPLINTILLLISRSFSYYFLF